MYNKSSVAITAVLAIAASSAIVLRAVIAQDQNVAVQSRNANVEVLARGPVHEAFAEPVTLQGFDPLVIDAAPPEPIEELPPEQKLEGDNVQWIPGYWAWEDDRQDFIWISGVWRECPPGQKWVPGYWSQNVEGWGWTPGFWVSEEVEQVEYLPEPPETLEEGPQVEAPSEDHVWVPGIWQYHEARYAWRPGYWTSVQPGWVWVPARYMWCPSGYVFVDGYWDYALARRGLLFAPVYYHQPIYRLPDYYYTPSVVISTDILTVHLFARPQYSHYYFGDYYAPRYREIGIEPWLMFPRIRGYYDPLFHYYSWYHARRGHDWQVMLRDRYEFFSRHEDYRPAHTYVGLQRQRFAPIRTGDVNIQNNIQNIVLQQNNLVVNFNQYIRNFEQNVRIDEDGGDRRDRMRFARLAPEERRNYFAHAREIRGFQQLRSEIESEPQITDRSQRSEFAREERQQRRALRLADYQTRQPRERRRDSERDVRRDVPPTPGLTAGIQRGEDRRRMEDRPEVDVDARQERLGEDLGRSDRARDEVGRRREAIGQQDRFQEPDVGQNVDLSDRNIEPSPRSRNRITDRGLGIAGETPAEARIAPDGTQMEDTVDRPIEESAPRVRRFGRDQALTDVVETDDAARLGPTFPQRSGRDDLRRRRDDDGRLLSEDQQRTLDQLRQLRRGEDRAGEMPIYSAGRSFGRSFDDRNVSPPESRDLRGQRGDRSQPLDRNRQFEAQRDLLRQRDTGRDPIRTPALAPDAQRRANQTPQQEFQRGRTRQDRAADRLGPSRENVERFLNERRDATSQRDIDRSGQLRTREPFGGRQFGQRGSDVVTPGTDRTPGRMVPGLQGDTMGRRSRFESFTEQQERRDTPDLGRQGLPSRDIEPRWGQREGQPWSEGRTRGFGRTLEQQRNFTPEQSDLDRGRQFRSGARSIPFGPGRDDSERQPPPRVRSDGARTFLRQRERTPLSPGREDRVFRGGAAAEAWSTTSPDQRRRERVQREDEDDD